MTQWTKRFSLEGRRALVTGASKGIGFETCRVLADAGADIAAVGRDEAGLAEVCKAVEALGRRCVPITADLATVEVVGTVTPPVSSSCTPSPKAVNLPSPLEVRFFHGFFLVNLRLPASS